MDCVLTLVLKGTFYRANEESSIVLHNVMHYKINHQRDGLMYCGFPESALMRVLAKLESHRISYRIYRPTSDDPLRVYKEKLFDDNRFQEYRELMDDGDIAYQFICHLCDLIDKAERSEKEEGVHYILDLEDQTVREKMLLVKQKLEDADKG